MVRKKASSPRERRTRKWVGVGMLAAGVGLGALAALLSPRARLQPAHPIPRPVQVERVPTRVELVDPSARKPITPPVWKKRVPTFLMLTMRAAIHAAQSPRNPEAAMKFLQQRYQTKRYYGHGVSEHLIQGITPGEWHDLHTAFRIGEHELGYAYETPPHGGRFSETGERRENKILLNVVAPLTKQGFADIEFARKMAFGEEPSRTNASNHIGQVLFFQYRDPQTRQLKRSAAVVTRFWKGDMMVKGHSVSGNLNQFLARHDGMVLMEVSPVDFSSK